MKRFYALCVLLCALLSSSGALAQVAAGGNHALYLDGNGAVWAWGANHRRETLPENEALLIATPAKVFEGAVQVACGRQFSLALDAQGEAWLWGNGLSEKQSLAKDTVKIAACESSYALLKSDGSAVYFDGQAERSFDLNATDVACGADFLLLVSDGSAYFYGDPIYIGQKDDLEAPAAVLSGAKSVFAACQTGMILGADGRLYVFGASGAEGRLGIDTTQWIASPTANGLENVLLGAPGLSAGGAIDEDGTLYLWGTLYSLLSVFGEDGLPYVSSAEDALIRYGKTPIPVYENAVSCALGDAFIVLELADGTVLTWGTNDWGQAGDGSSTLFTYAEDDGDGEFLIEDNRQMIFPAYPRFLPQGE